MEGHAPVEDSLVETRRAGLSLSTLPFILSFCDHFLSVWWFLEINNLFDLHYVEVYFFSTYHPNVRGCAVL